jgi:hypothetical protein
VIRFADPRLLSLIVVVHVLAGLVSAWATPVFEAPDEGFHVAVVRWINQGNGLPVQDPANPGDYQQEASQPPLYYLIGSALTFWIDVSDWDAHFEHNPRSRIGVPGTTHNVNDYKPVPVDSGPARLTHALRALSLALSVGTVIAIWTLAGQLAPGDGPLQVLATVVMALNPKAVFINASANNDNLLMLLSTLVLIGCVRHMKQRADDGSRKTVGHDAVLLGLLLGLAALTKVSGLVLWPIAGLALVWRPVVQRDWPGLAAALAQGVLMAGVALAVSGWWFGRNWLLYGDLLGLEAMVAVAGLRPPDLSPLSVLANEWYGFYLSYWAVFGVFTVQANELYHVLVHALSLTAAAGCLFHLVRVRGRLSPAVWLLVAFTGLTLVGVVRWTLQTPASQGRLLFGAIAPLSIGLAAGWLALIRRGVTGTSAAVAGGNTQRLSWALTLAVAAVLAGAAFYIPLVDVAPRYRAPVPVASSVPAIATPVNAVLGDGLELLAFSAHPAPVAPGGTQRLTLYWRAQTRLAHDDVTVLALQARGQPVSVLDTWPGRGLLPLTQMQPGVVYADEYDLPVSASAREPALLELRVGLWRGDPETRLPVRDGAGRAADDAVLRVGRVIGPGLPPPAGDPLATFEHGIRLWSIGTTVPGQELDLVWDATEPVPADYTLFVHALDAGNQKVGQADGPPLGGDWPTSAWVPGRAFVDDRTLNMPAEIYRCLRLGWYDPATGQRLAAFGPQGQPLPDGAVVVDLGSGASPPAVGSVCPP